MKPLIGINLDITEGPPEEARIQTSYTDAILKSGGIPILLPPMPDEDLAEMLRRLDGLMLIGGPDYCPSLYKEEADPTVELVHQRRQQFDLKLLRLALKRANMPLLGVCAGAQLLNIELGGSLVQDIKSEFGQSKVEHSTVGGSRSRNGYHKHEVMLDKDSIVAGIYKVDRVAVPTNHHQSIKVVGSGLKATAHADDGIIEAVELAERQTVVGVQWHPERDYENNKPLFDWLISVSCQTQAAGGRE